MAGNTPNPSEEEQVDFILSAQQFISYLTMHHDIEEAHVFPELGKRMPEFRDQGDMKMQHKAIHDGLDAWKEVLEACEKGDCNLV